MNEEKKWRGDDKQEENETEEEENKSEEDEIRITRILSYNLRLSFFLSFFLSLTSTFSLWVSKVTVALDHIQRNTRQDSPWRGIGLSQRPLPDNTQQLTNNRHPYP
jgi:hypothetical protein